MAPRLGPSHSRGMKRVHVGCGPHNALADWWNVDIRRFPGVDEIMDVTQPWRWRDLEYVYAEHFLEHLALDQALVFLEQAGNSLRPDGVMRLSTPNLEWVLATHFRVGPMDLETRLRETLVLNRAFYGWGHRFIYSKEMLAHLLREQGFPSVDFQSYGESANPDLRGLERHGGFQVDAGHPSVVIVEATRGRAPVATPADLRQRLEEEFLQHVRFGH